VISESEIAVALRQINYNINPCQGGTYSDSDVGTVGSIVEAQISIAKGLFAIALAINNLSETIKDKP